MKIFLTGGTGFIGAHFLRLALAEGFHVTSLKRKACTASCSPAGTNLKWLRKGFSEVTVEDLRDHDVLVHLAAHSANVPYDSLRNCVQLNVMQPLELFYNAASAGISRFIVAGTCFEYGSAAAELESIPVSTALTPAATYPASKAAASIIFRAFAAENKVGIAYHRIFQVFGEGEVETRLWPTMKRAALGGEDLQLTPGEQVRDFIPVETVAGRLLRSAIDDELAPGEMVVANLCSGIPQSIREFCEFWWRHWNAQGKLVFGALPYRCGEVMRYVGE